MTLATPIGPPRADSATASPARGRPLKGRAHQASAGLPAVCMGINLLSSDRRLMTPVFAFAHNEQRGQHGPAWLLLRSSSYALTTAIGVKEQHADVGTPTSQPCIRCRTGILDLASAGPALRGSRERRRRVHVKGAAADR